MRIEKVDCVKMEKAVAATGHSDRAEELILACGRGATTKWGPIQVQFQERSRRGGGCGGGQPEGVAVL